MGKVMFLQACVIVFMGVHRECTPSLDASPWMHPPPSRCTPHPRRQTANQRSVRILLECKLVSLIFVVAQCRHSLGFSQKRRRFRFRSDKNEALPVDKS